jgi:hypothetical protein
MAIAAAIAAIFVPAAAPGFCTGYEAEFLPFDPLIGCPDSSGHREIMGDSLFFLRSPWYGIVDDQHEVQDFPEWAGGAPGAKGDNRRHFDSCSFAQAAGYIDEEYEGALEALDPADPALGDAARHFGRLLHTAEDFYAHSNWLELLGFYRDFGTIDPGELARSLVDGGLGPWAPIEPLGVIRDDIVVGELRWDEATASVIPLEQSLPGWTARLPLASAIPTVSNAERTLRALVTGWNHPSGGARCLDVRTPVDDQAIYPFDFDGLLDFAVCDGYGCPRTSRLVHGGGSDPRPCEGSFPTSVCLSQDNATRPFYPQAELAAVYQTAHEWCRLLHLAQGRWGYDASSMLMTLWVAAGQSPHPLSTPCGFTGRPGPIGITVTPHVLDFAHPYPWPARTSYEFVFALYTGDFRRSTRTHGRSTQSWNEALDPVTMCVASSEALVATVWGAELEQIAGIWTFHAPMLGVTHVIPDPGNVVAGSFERSTDDLSIRLDVEIDTADPDADGLTGCAEQYYGTLGLVADTDGDGLLDGAEVTVYGTDPTVPDTDGDGLHDGAEVNAYGTNPLAADTDGDALDDGAEVNVHGTNPLAADTDADALDDGAEVNVYGTNPLSGDTDSDGLPDGLEVACGTDPLVADSDGDGLADGAEPGFLVAAAGSAPLDAWVSTGARRATLERLMAAEVLLAHDRSAEALRVLRDVRGRIDGCGAAPERDDWLLDCGVQTEVRAYLDLLVGNLTG